MRALTVREPWATAIIHIGKDVENRTNLPMWARLAGEQIAIHAGARMDGGAFTDPVLRRAGRPDVAYRPGCILGVVTVTDVHWASDCGNGCSPWAYGYWAADPRICHLTLADPRPLAAPIFIRGKLGAWHLPDDVTDTLLTDLASQGVSA